MRPTTKPMAAAIMGIAVLTWPPGAYAQAPAEGRGAPAQVPASRPVSDQKLTAAATALVHVTKLKSDYQEQISKAPTSDKDRIANEAVTALRKAITDQGLSVDEYDSIITLAQNDPAIREKLIQRAKSVGE